MAPSNTARDDPFGGISESFRPSWICRSPADRARLLEMEARLAPAYRMMRTALPLSLIAASFWAGPWALLPVAGAVPFMIGGPRLMQRTHAPEYVVAAMAAAMLVSLTVAAALTGGLASPILFWLVMPAFALPVRFGPRMTATGLAAELALLLGTSFAFARSSFGAHPANAITLTAAIASCGIFTGVMASTERRYRSASSIDALTGLLNRYALERRISEVVEQAHASDGWLGLIICDLDRFKAVNDEHGHAKGDAVLRDTAAALRGGMRSFELLYRLGGEEFLVLLPGADLNVTKAIAERLRHGVAAAHPGGLDVTLSAGVSAARGRDVDFQQLSEHADRGLYRAKRRGRNCVEVAPEPGPVARDSVPVG